MSEEQKTCAKCGQTKNIEEFAKHKGRKNTWCKTCHNQYYKEYFHKYDRMDKQSKRVCINKTQYRERVTKEKCQKGCQICGYNRCGAALEYHHINKKEKSFNISSAYCMSPLKIENEKKKCVLVCANCHREITAGLIAL